MTQVYSDPKRAEDPHALPDVEVFYHDGKSGSPEDQYGDNPLMEVGWYWWSCFPGCLPDSDPVGPFATEAEAIADASKHGG